MTERSYPLLAAPRISGARCAIINGIPLRRSGHPVVNQKVYEMLSGLPPLVGSIVVGVAGSEGVLTQTTAALDDREGKPEFKFWVFDVELQQRLPLNQRLDIAKEWCGSCGNWIEMTPHMLVRSEAQFKDLEARYMFAGFRGLVARSPDSLYETRRAKAKTH